MNISSLTLPLQYHPSMDILDSTKLHTYMSCPRQFFYEYVLGWRSARPNNHLHFGKAVHLALEHILINGYTTTSVIESLDLFNNEYRSAFPESTDSIFSPKTPSRFFDMMIQYVGKYKDDLLKYKVYKTEIGGTIHLSPTHIMAYKMDTILQDQQTGQYCSLEHKTKGGNYIGQDYFTDFKLSVQVGTYTHVLNSIFPPEEVSGIIINCMCFKKTKAPEFLLERQLIGLSNNQMYNWMHNTMDWIDLIHRDFAELEQTSPGSLRMNCFSLNGRSCTNWGRVCQYHDLCMSWNNPLQHLDHLPVDMQVEFWNPLEEDLREVITL